MTRSTLSFLAILGSWLASPSWAQDAKRTQVVIPAGDTVRVPLEGKFKKAFIHDDGVARIVATDGEGWLIQGVGEGKTTITLTGQHPLTETRPLVVLPNQRSFVILKNNPHKMSMTTQKPIQKVVIADEGAVAREPAETNRHVVFRGLAEGTTRVTLTDSDGNVESYRVQVQSNQLYLKVGGTIKLQLTTREPISQAINEKESVARISILPGDPTSVLVTGLTPGITRITLVGADGRKETRESK